MLRHALQKPAFYAVSAYLIVSACTKSGRSPELTGFLKKNLEYSTQYLAARNTAIHNSFLEKTKDTLRYNRFSEFQTVQLRIRDWAKELLDYLERLKSAVSEETSGSGEVLNALMSHEAKGLYERLSRFRQAVASSHPEIEKSLALRLVTVTGSHDSLTRDEFYHQVFGNCSTMETAALLSTIQNNIRALESQAFAFCHNKIANIILCGWPGRPWPIIHQSSKRLRAGDDLTITAGMGGMATARDMDIHNGRKVDIDAQGFANYYFRAPREAGNYKIPVTCAYTNPDGANEYCRLMVSYTVTEK